MCQGSHRVAANKGQNSVYNWDEPLYNWSQLCSLYGVWKFKLEARQGATSLYVFYRCVQAMVAVEFASFKQKEKQRLSLSASS